MQPGGSLEAWTIGRETKALSLVMTHQLVLLNTHLLSDIIVQRQHRTLGSPWSLFSNTRFIWFFHRVLKLFISKIVQIFKHTFFSFDFEFFFVHAGLPAKVKTRTESPETLCILSDDSFNSTLSTPAVALLTNSEYANGKYSWQGKANPANGGWQVATTHFLRGDQMGIPLTLQSTATTLPCCLRHHQLELTHLTRACLLLLIISWGNQPPGVMWAHSALRQQC